MAVETKLRASIFAGGYVLPTTGILVGPSGFHQNDKVVIDKLLNTKEENYVKGVFGDKILLNNPLKYTHDYHAAVENRFQGLAEIIEFDDPNASSVDVPRVVRRSLSGANPNNGSIIVDAVDSANRVLIHQTDNGSSSYEEIYLWAYNDDNEATEVTIEFGGLSENINPGGPIVYQSQNILKIKVPSREGLFAIFNGLLLQNSLRVTAFSEKLNKITLRGHVNKIDQTSLNQPIAQSPIVFNSSCIGWGENFFGQASVPSSLYSTKRDTIKHLAAGYNNSFAVLKDDSLVGWGTNANGQLSVPSMFTPSSTTTSIIHSIDKIAVGSNHVLGLYRDANLNTYVTSWGGYAENTVPLNLGVVKDVAAGSNHSLALLDGGTVVGWGENSYGQAKGVASSELATGQFGGNVSGATGELLDDVTAISAGANHSLALRTDSGVVAWGSNYAQQCDVPSSATDVIQIAAGFNHSLALKNDGSVIAWGNNEFEQIDVPLGLSVPNPDISGIASAGNMSLAFTKLGQVHVWGGSADTSFVSKLKAPPTYDIKNIYCGTEHAISTNMPGMRSNGVPVI